MTHDKTIQALNELIAIHSRSLAMYLSFASPSWHVGDERARETLQHIVADQQSFVERLVELVVDAGGPVNYGAFPMEFTNYHDLSFSFLLGKLIEYQKRDIAAIERCANQLADAPMARALAEEALGAAKAHLESLQELKPRLSAPAAH